VRVALIDQYGRELAGHLGRRDPRVRSSAESRDGKAVDALGAPGDEARQHSTKYRDVIGAGSTTTGDLTCAP
jgi:hypothetical protein